MLEDCLPLQTGSALSYYRRMLPPGVYVNRLAI